MISKEQLRDMILNNEDISGIDYSHLTDMSFMFSGCSSLVSVPEFDTSKVINMNFMFADCSSLVSVPDLDTSNVQNMSGMFEGTPIEIIPEKVLKKQTKPNYRKKIQALIKLYKD